GQEGAGGAAALARALWFAVDIFERLKKVVQVAGRLVQRFGHEPRPDEIAAELELTTAEVREIVRMAQFPVSLEKPLGEEGDARLGDLVEDELAEPPLEAASLSRRFADIKHALASLPARQRRVIELR